MYKKPKVSVLMNCYNSERFIKKSINSVINQTYKNWELIIWDDGSKDNTYKIISKFKDPVDLKLDEWKRPNGLKIHKDGRIFIACYKYGIMEVNPNDGTVTTVLGSVFSEGFKGTNDLHFAKNGDMYFTDQGQTGIADPTGRVFRWGADGSLDRLAVNVPSPNGITLNLKENQCYVAVTRTQQIWRLPLMADGNVSKTGVAIQLSGGHAGPDGIETDSQDGLLVCHLGVGIWRFDDNGLPTHLIHSGDAHRLMTNIAFGGPDNKTLYITDSLNGNIMSADFPIAGKTMYGLS